MAISTRTAFDDVVSVAATVYAAPIPQTPYPTKHGGAFDESANYFEIFRVSADTGDPMTTAFTWNEFDHPNGDLSVQLNSGDNGFRSVSVTTLGTKGLTRNGRVNRDGIGAIVRFRPRRGLTAMRAVMGGASYQSQDSRTLTFGLGRARRGMVEVAWPGGVRNRLYGVRAGERIVLPEIPCSFTTSKRLSSYRTCVREALNELVARDLISRPLAHRLHMSAIRAYLDAGLKRAM